MGGFPREAAREIVERGLLEDLGRRGDITTSALLGRTRTRAAVIAREPAVVAGIELAGLVMEAFARRDAGVARATPRVRDGQEVAAGDLLVELEGAATAVLGGERLLLNLMARLSGIATLTRQAVREVEGTGVEIADTRKTTPGLRALEKYAVTAGGGVNHRFTLDELVMIKDNHKLLCGGAEAALMAALRAGHAPGEIELEADTLEEVEVGLAAGCGWILLDNMTVDQVREAVRLAAGRCRLEVSGGLRPGGLRVVAETGVDRLSLGCLTHSARAVDLALDARPPR